MPWWGEHPDDLGAARPPQGGMHKAREGAWPLESQGGRGTRDVRITNYNGRTKRREYGSA